MRYKLNPAHQAGQFCRTVRLEGREPRLLKFTPEVVIDIDDDEAKFLVNEIAREIILREGALARLKRLLRKEPPIRHELEDDRASREFCRRTLTPYPRRRS